MKYKERDKTRASTLPKRKYNRHDLVELDQERFWYFLREMGGHRVVSERIGYSDGYINHALRDYDGMLPFPAFVRICDIYEIPDKYFMGYGENRVFRKLVERIKPKKKEKHALCDDYCIGCIYTSMNPSISLPPERGCDYNYVTGLMRGCPAGTGCDKREIGQRNGIKAMTVKY